VFVDVPPPPAAPLTVSDERVAPRKIFLGRNRARIRFTLSADVATATVELVGEKPSRIARRIVLNEIRSRAAQRVSWNGVTERGGAAKDGRYRVRLIVPGHGVRRLLGKVIVRGHMYPIRGHTTIAEGSAISERHATAAARMRVLTSTPLVARRLRPRAPAG
jgi:hypothetical protein